MTSGSKTVLQLLHSELEATGLKPGSKPFLKEERRRKVEMCRDQKNVQSCWDCGYFDSCELLKSHLRDVYKVKS